MHIYINIRIWIYIYIYLCIYACKNAYIYVCSCVPRNMSRCLDSIVTSGQNARRYIAHSCVANLCNMFCSLVGKSFLLPSCLRLQRMCDTEGGHGWAMSHVRHFGRGAFLSPSAQVATFKKLHWHAVALQWPCTSPFPIGVATHNLQLHDMPSLAVLLAFIAMCPQRTAVVASQKNIPAFPQTFANKMHTYLQGHWYKAGVDCRTPSSIRLPC